MKLKKVSISGRYKSGEKTKDFQVSGLVPAVNDDKVRQHVQARYAPMWISDGGKNSRPDTICPCYIDEIETVEAKKLTLIGKNIKEMSFEELQDLATLFDLMGIPLYKEDSLSETRRKAILEWSVMIDGANREEAKIVKEGMLSDMPDIIVKVEGSEDEPEVPAPVEPAPVVVEKTAPVAPTPIVAPEPIAADPTNKADPTQITEEGLTIEDMREIATKNDIKFNAAIGFDKLYDRLLDEGLVK